MYVELLGKNIIYCSGVYDFIKEAQKQKDLFLGVKRFLSSLDDLRHKKNSILFAKTAEKIIKILEEENVDLYELGFNDLDTIKEMIMLADKAYTVEMRNEDFFCIYEVSDIFLENVNLETKLKIDTILNMV